MIENDILTSSRVEHIAPIETNLPVEYLNHYKLDEWGELCYKHLGDAGFDLRAAIEQPIIIRTMKYLGEHCKIVPAGIKFQIPFGYEIQVRPRSGLAAKHQLIIVNGPGTIDHKYRKEVHIILMNLGAQDIVINPGDRVAQAVLAAIPINVDIKKVKAVESTERGGFGSTGIT